MDDGWYLHLPVALVYYVNSEYQDNHLFLFVDFKHFINELYFDMSIPYYFFLSVDRSLVSGDSTISSQVSSLLTFSSAPVGSNNTGFALSSVRSVPSSAGTCKLLASPSCKPPFVNVFLWCHIFVFFNNVVLSQTILQIFCRSNILSRTKTTQ